MTHPPRRELSRLINSLISCPTYMDWECIGSSFNSKHWAHTKAINHMSVNLEYWMPSWITLLGNEKRIVRQNKNPRFRFISISEKWKRPVNLISEHRQRQWEAKRDTLPIIKTSANSYSINMHLYQPQSPSYTPLGSEWRSSRTKVPS